MNDYDKTETDSQTQTANYCLPARRRKGEGLYRGIELSDTNYYVQNK